MTCREFWDLMPELEAVEGVPELSAHAGQCPGCAALLNGHNAISSGLKRLGDENRHRQAPLRVEARLLRTFREQNGLTPKRWERRRRVPWLAWASAAVVVLAAALYLVRAHQPAPARVPQTGNSWMAANFPSGEPAGATSEFIPTPYADDTALTDDSDLVRVEVPRSTLVALGVPVPLGGPARVEAEVALDSHGVVQGVRLLQ